MARRRTKKQYTDLYHDPRSLFEGVNTILWPNGEPEIWVQGKDGKGFRIKVSEGDAGLSVEVEAFPLGPVPDVYLGDEEHTVPQASRVAIVQYNRDPWSQEFRKWYRRERDSYPGEKPREGQGA